MNYEFECGKLYNQIKWAYLHQSGGHYNDTLYAQWMGAEEEMYEAETSGDWEWAYKTLSDCWRYVNHCKKIDEMQQEMPKQVYG